MVGQENKADRGDSDGNHCPMDDKRGSCSMSTASSYDLGQVTYLFWVLVLHFHVKVPRNGGS